MEAIAVCTFLLYCSKHERGVKDSCTIRLSLYLLINFYVIMQTADYLRNHTYPNVPGNKYILLIQYFTFLEQCIEHGATIEVSTWIQYTHSRNRTNGPYSICAITYSPTIYLLQEEIDISVHLQLLKKFKSALPSKYQHYCHDSRSHVQSLHVLIAHCSSRLQKVDVWPRGPATSPHSSPLFFQRSCSCQNGYQDP